MTKKELEGIRARYVSEHNRYKMIHWQRFNYKTLDNVMYSTRTGKISGGGKSFSDAIIMADSETSKKRKRGAYHNHVCAWTISIRAFNQNIVTLYGKRPDNFCECLQKIRDHLSGDNVVVYFHNLPYDWVFFELFLFEKFGTPDKQLNIRSHYPLFVTFENGIQLRDSLILAQRSLEKWAADLEVEHQKSVGKWDYDKIRYQKGNDFTPDELEYIEHDTLAGVECIQKTLDALGKKIYTAPYTSTGIVREEVRKKGKQNNARALFERIAPTYEQYKKLEQLFHGGFTHGNRHLIEELIESLVQCFDFASSYPFVMLTEKYAMEKFHPFDDCRLEDILKSKDHAFMFKLILIKPHLKSDFEPMPVLQFSKCKTINALQDNGRILKADYVELYTNEVDARLIRNMYDWDSEMCVEVETAYKDYLPRWFTDYIFELFRLKCELKGGDPVLYALAKARLNSMYGLTCQHSIKETIEENYITGEFTPDDTKDEKEEYQKYLDNKNNILPYFWGCWVTSYAMSNLFELGKCIKEDGKISHWIYSDTDSIYSDAWDIEKVGAYNERAKQKLRDNNYGPVVINGREFWLGVAEHKEKEDDYTQFVVNGAKRYCGRCVDDGKIHITVAGVPKKGAAALKDNIKKFKKGFIFPGSVTGKKEHKYFYVDKIYKDRHGNLTGHSIDLSPCNYKLDKVKIEDPDWFQEFTSEDLYMQVYDEGRI